MVPASTIAKGDFRLDLEDLSKLRTYLVERGFAEAEEAMTAERAGEGNMNCVVRVRMQGRNVILKQALPWVAKYPSIAAPVERATSEARFYYFVTQSSSVAAMMPRLLDFDESSAVLIMEDLSPAETLLDCYQGTRSLNWLQLKELAHYTSSLHRLTIPQGERAAFQNGAMRKLNYQHIFDIPLRTDGALSEMLEQITPGLDRVGDGLRRDRTFCEAVERLGRSYLEQDGPSLIHGDLFPGSLLQIGQGRLRVIDPEFSFCGNPEFDIGVFYAHLLLSRHEEDTASFWLQVALEGTPHSETLVIQYAGVEIMRRILGVAQLPVSLSLEAKGHLLERSREMLVVSVKGRK
ncbi:MAG TPA: phosphotransferase [Terrimicrobiaceae bacterium]